jgi:CheY-like chemotaxis protein
MSQPSILIVDDEETLTWSMSKSLSKDRDKYKTLTGNTGREALEILKQHKVDLVITDIRMPDVNGLDLLSTIRQDYPDTKVIIMTAYGSSEIQKDANKRGSLYYIEKPFEIADIRKLILDVLGKRRGFEGSVFDLQLTDVIQLNCLCRITAALKVDRGDQEGVIYFDDGELVHAECEGKTGKEALFAILSWREGKFDHERGARPAQQTISQNWEHLLVEGMRKSDEELASTGGALGIPSGAYSPPVEKKDSQIAVTVHSQNEEGAVELAVEAIAGMTGCEGTVIVSEDGTVLAHRAVEDATREGIVVASLGAFSRRVSQILKTGELKCIQLGRKKRKVILESLPQYVEVRLREGVRFEQVSPSIWKAVEMARHRGL